MDPNAIARVMRDDTLDRETRHEAAINLSNWLVHGGFPQDVPGGRDGNVADAMEEARHFLVETAA